MSERLIDEAARKRIRDDIRTGMAVEAAAGTGKTTEMVERILSLVRSGVPIRGIAAITFTDKAAAELELRVREELESAAGTNGGADTPVGEDRGDKSVPSTNNEAGRFAAALAELDTAQISTIHAFALSLIKERPVEAGVDPEARIMDEVQDALWFSEAWQGWIEGLDTDGFAQVSRALQLGLSRDQLEQTARDLAKNRDVAGILRECLQGPDRVTAEAVAAKIGSIVSSADKLVKECELRVKDRNDKRFQAVLALREALGAFRGGSPDWPLWEKFLEVNATAITGLRGGSKKCWDCEESLEQAGAALKQARQEIEAAQDMVRTLALDQVLLLLCAFVANDWNRRRLAGLINFQDVLILARDLLLHPEARQYYQRRWSRLLVDEFQDTDPLQVEIIDLLFGDNPQGLFLVGDPKQSIYRFRRADIAIYRKRVGELNAAIGRESEVLKTNFRSVPGIVAWVNRTFDRIIRERGPYQAAYSEMKARRKDEPGLPPPVSVLQPADEEIFSARVPAQRAVEANHIAALVERLTATGAYRVYDKNEQAMVPLAYKHVAVLYFTRPGEPEAWLAPFQERGIPFVTDLGQSFFMRDEVAAVHLALRAIEDPSDSLALFGALRSSLFGFSDEEMFMFKDAGGRLDYRKDAGKFNAGVEAAFALFREWHQERNLLPIARTIERVLDASGARLGSLVSRKDDLGVMNLDRLLSHARAYQELPGADFSGFVTRLADIAELEADAREPITLDPDEDFVRFSTVHSAKGLEFPVVIVANMNSNAERKAGKVLVDRLEKKRAAVAVGKLFRSSGYDRMAEEEELHELEQAKRLLYVAATRARGALVLSVFPPLREEDREKKEKDKEDGKEKSACFIDLLPDEIKSWARGRFGQDKDGVLFWDPAGLALDVTQKKVRKGRPPAADAGTDLREFIAERGRLLARAAQGIKVRTATGDRERPRERITPEGAAVELPASASSPAMRMGSLVHEIMEQTDLSAPAPDRALVASLASAAGLRDHATEAERLVKNLLSSAPLRRAAAAGSWQKEVPYCVWLDGVSHEGKMDLIFRESGHVVVVDYKTDDVSAEDAPAKVEEYRNQCEEYRQAAKMATGIKKVEVWFVFARPGVAVKLDGMAGTAHGPVAGPDHS